MSFQKRDCCYFVVLQNQNGVQYEIKITKHSTVFEKGRPLENRIQPSVVKHPSGLKSVSYGILPILHPLFPLDSPLSDDTNIFSMVGSSLEDSSTDVNIATTIKKANKFVCNGNCKQWLKLNDYEEHRRFMRRFKGEWEMIDITCEFCNSLSLLNFAPTVPALADWGIATPPASSCDGSRTNLPPLGGRSRGENQSCLLASGQTERVGQRVRTS